MRTYRYEESSDSVYTIFLRDLLSFYFVNIRIILYIYLFFSRLFRLLITP